MTKQTSFDIKEACDFLTAHCSDIDWLGMQNCWTATPQYLAFVGDYIVRHKPNTILECGSGLSTLIIASLLRKVGKSIFVSLEHDYACYKKTKRLLTLHGLAGYANVCFAPLKEFYIDHQTWKWYDYECFIAAPIDLLVVDGPPQRIQPMARYPVLPLLQTQLSDHAVLILDDGHRPSEKRCVERWESRLGVKSVLFPHERGTFLVSAKNKPFPQTYSNTSLAFPCNFN